MNTKDTRPGRARAVTAWLLALLVISAAACSNGDSGWDSAASTSTVAAAADYGDETETTTVDSGDESAAGTTVAAVGGSWSGADADTYAIEYSDRDLDASATTTPTATITLNGGSAVVEGSGATASGSLVTITAAGTFLLSGTLDDGQIVVDAAASADVRLILDGVDVTCSTSAPLYVRNADKVVVTLAGGSENRLIDGDSYAYADEATAEPNAALFSNDDLTINGTGSLTVIGRYNDGIASDDDLKIVGGNITVTAADDGLRGRDSVLIGGGTITITAGGDGIKAGNEDDAAQGYVVIEDGTLEITSGGDGVQAVTGLVVGGGDLTITAGGGGGGLAGDSADSTKGLKAGVDLVVSGGTFEIDATDDALHSDGSVTITGGTLSIATGDDGIHAEEFVTIEEGELTITGSYEGIEGASITINGGEIHVTATDDGINTVAAGTTATGQASPGGQGGPGGGMNRGTSPLYINGGYAYIDAMGDGIDANGPIEMTGGTLIINGPTADNNGALDFTQFTISGGLLVAVGSSGMARAPGESSPQESAGLAFRSTLAAGTMIHIAAADGTGVLTFVSTKEFSSVVLSSPVLETGATYVVYTGGSHSGAVVDGVYSGGIYAPGTEAGTFTM